MTFMRATGRLVILMGMIVLPWVLIYFAYYAFKYGVALVASLTFFPG